MTRRPGVKQKRFLFTALAENVDEALIIDIQKRLNKWQAKNVMHDAPNVAMIGTLLWLVANYTKQTFPDPEAGEAAIGTFGEYLTHMLEVLEQEDSKPKETMQ